MLSEGERTVDLLLPKVWPKGCQPLQGVLKKERDQYSIFPCAQGMVSMQTRLEQEVQGVGEGKGSVQFIPWCQGISGWKR